MMMIKGKRTKRSRPLSPLALTMSNTVTDEEEDMAHCLILLAQGTNQKGNNNGITSYECKTCNKTFSSFQALGGHRASHRKPKSTLSLSYIKKSTISPSIMFSLINTDHNNHHPLDNDNTTLSLQIPRPMLITSSTNKGNKVHECGICGAEFSSGQALGGHMRRHRPINTIPIPFEDVTNAANNMIKEERAAKRNLESLDLNLPAPDEEQQQQHQHQHQYSFSKFVFPSNEKTLVFSASSHLVDCHY